MARVEAASVVVDPQAQLCLNMSDGVVIRLGRADDLETKVSLVKKIYRERPDVASEIASIDLTAPEHPACTPRSKSEKREDRKSNSDG